VLARESESSGIELWPVLSGSEPVFNDHESTLGIQREFSASKAIPVPLLDASVTKQAVDLIERHSDGKLAVAVHVKNVQNGEGTANGRIEVWAEFMERVSARGEVAFFAVGLDDYEKLQGIPGVTLSQDHQNKLELDLAIIQSAQFFMGTAAGPAHVAILGDKPYGVFKPLDVHREHMDRELGGNDNFPFARTGQQFHRIDPDVDFLVQELDRLIESLEL
jgi:ADP-heptose:LPS heptosyltransferase